MLAVALADAGLGAAAAARGAGRCRDRLDAEGREPVARRKRAYVTNFGQHNGHNIEVVDAKTLAHIDTIDLPGNVVESVLSPDGTTIFASNFLRNSVQFVDVKTKRVTKEIPTGHTPEDPRPLARRKAALRGELVRRLGHADRRGERAGSCARSLRARTRAAWR